MKNRISSIIQKIMDSGTSKTKLVLAAIELVAMVITIFGVIPKCQLLAVLGYIFLIAVLIYTWKKEDYEEIKIIAITIMYFYFVYSTYLGRTNWLGSNFYKIIMFIDIPLGWVLLALSMLFICSIYLIVKPYIKFKYLSSIIVFTLFFDLIVWYPLSFISYYSGVEGKIMDISRLLSSVTEKVLHGNESDATKDKILHDIYKKVSFRAKLYKNGQEYLETDASRFVIENPRAANVVFEHEETILVGKDRYHYSASRVYRPDDFTGVTRAITWSVFPDRFGDDADLEAQGIAASSNAVYLGRRKAGRSMNWWLIFAATFGLFCTVRCYYKKRELRMAAEKAKLEADLKATEKKLYQQYHNAGLYQELLFSQLSREFNDIMASRAKSHLQEYVASLGKNETKKVLNEQGFEATMENIQTSIGDRVHTLKNQWNKYDNMEEDNTGKIVQIILDDLRSLKTVFDVSYSKQALSDIDSTVVNAVPKQYQKIRSLKFIARYFDTQPFETQYVIIANLDRLKSIVSNLLQNSFNAAQRFKLALPKEERRLFLAKLSLVTNIEEYDGKKYYTIAVQDNGGGFPNPAIIYKEPVVSSDTSAGERMGAGTVYIDMFVKRMKGFIQASNEVFEDGYMGAKTKIYIPLVSKEEAEEEL